MAQSLHAGWFVSSLKEPFAQLTHEPTEVPLCIPLGHKPHERISQWLVLNAITRPGEHLLGETHGRVVSKPTIVSELVVNEVVINDTETLPLF